MAARVRLTLPELGVRPSQGERETAPCIYAPLTAGPLRHAFRHRAGRAAATDHDLVPYWIYPAENGAFIEHRVPAYPLSRDELFHAFLRRSLAAYRMVFGQSPQDHSMACLLERLPWEELERWAGKMRMDLGVGEESRPGEQGCVGPTNCHRRK